jgi:transmembrane sensor
MQHPGQEIQSLITKWQEGNASPAEMDRLLELLETEDIEKVLSGAMKERWEQLQNSNLTLPERLAGTADTIVTKYPAHANEVPVRRMKTTWLRYAAAILIIAGIGSYLFLNNQKEKPSVTQNNPHPLNNDVAPGGNKATLTLADGSAIALDSAGNGRLAQERNARIEKRGGQVVYVPILPAREGPGTVQYNTMATPRGGQYQLVLPDGSRVWLNAESSITYPTAFTGDERRVSITGEAYFEVAHNARQPFRVEAASQVIEVLGTKFNINTYKDEATINTTLLEGSVRLTSSVAHTAVHTSLILKPGQQGQLTDRGLFLAANPDIEQAVAWKNGLFNFNKVKFKDAMHQIERWYDVDIEYKNGIPDITFGGKMQRDLNLVELLRLLNAMGVRFSIEGKKLIVSQ